MRGMADLKTNTLFYGDNLGVLRSHFPDECVDLIYLDPPFNSSRSYNVLFKEAAMASSPAQIEAFEDTWHWGDSAQHAFEQVALHGSDDTARLLKALVDALGHNDVTAYLSMMAVRLIELRRVLKPTGSIYLHCDPSASHYLKVVLDSIFGPANFRNEIVWKRTTAHSSAKRYAPIHDVLFYYGKSDQVTWNGPRTDYEQEYLDKYYRFDDGDGRLYWRDNLCAAGTRKGRSGLPWRGIDPTAKGMHWKFTIDRLDELDSEGRIYWPKGGTMPQYKRHRDELKGKASPDIWDDINRINPVGRERLGYPTQKPLALLERIIGASSNAGDMVLDPFCGCGTAVHAAEKLGRQWTGIDVTYLAIGLIEQRMRDAFPGITINEVGVPADLPGAQALAAHDPYQFQFWAVHQLGGAPVSGQNKKGADSGIDGVIPFIEGATGRRRVMISVKAGNLQPAFVRELKGVLEREREPIGVLVTLREPTKAMLVEAVATGSYHSEFWQKDYPRVQIITAAELLSGKRVEMPPQVSPFAQASRERSTEGEQTKLI
ncbi:MAG TPA: DNA methyltransferase [Dehalococcoidia bacterium]